MPSCVTGFSLSLAPRRIDHRLLWSARLRSSPFRLPPESSRRAQIQRSSNTARLRRKLISLSQASVG